MDYSLKDKIAQMLLVGIPNKESIPGIINLIKNYHIGGVILYKKDYSSLKEMVYLINKLKEANKGNSIPLTIAIDQEGGRVNRLPAELDNIKSAYRLALDGEDKVLKASDLTSKVLNKLGINMNFSPVLDIRSQKDDNGYIGNRAYSNDVDIISKMGSIYVDAHIKNNVMPVIKHYPGHGNINIDSHFFLPVIKDFSLDRIDLKPFNDLISKNVPALMVGHIVLSKFTGHKPATLSKEFVNDFIRKESKYEGLIITDELGMRAIRIFYGKYRSMKMAFLAENDIICCKYSKDYVEKCFDILEDISSSINIDYHFNKIVNYKKKYNYSDDPIKEDIDIDRINEEIKIINES